ARSGTTQVQRPGARPLKEESVHGRLPRPRRRSLAAADVSIRKRALHDYSEEGRYRHAAIIRAANPRTCAVKRGVDPVSWTPNLFRGKGTFGVWHLRIRRRHARYAQVVFPRSSDFPPDRLAISRFQGIEAAPGGPMIVRLTHPAVVVFAFVVSAMARAQVPSPTIEGPIASPAGAFIGSAGMVDLSQVGYEQQEYFISGTASAY